MKKVIYIAFVAVGFFAVSCTKERIQPCTQNSGDAPVWRSASTGDDTEGDGTGNGSITDPNNDPDESSRKKN
jgi:hypothetical protein